MCKNGSEVKRNSLIVHEKKSSGRNYLASNFRRGGVRGFASDLRSPFGKIPLRNTMVTALVVASAAENNWEQAFDGICNDMQSQK